MIKNMNIIKRLIKIIKMENQKKWINPDTGKEYDSKSQFKKELRQEKQQNHKK